MAARPQNPGGRGKVNLVMGRLVRTRAVWRALVRIEVRQGDRSVAFAQTGITMAAFLIAIVPRLEGFVLFCCFRVFIDLLISCSLRDRSLATSRRPPTGGRRGNLAARRTPGKRRT